MKKLFCLSAALVIGAIFIMANPAVTRNGPDMKKKKEDRKEQEKAKTDVSLDPPGRSLIS